MVKVAQRPLNGRFYQGDVKPKMLQHTKWNQRNTLQSPAMFVKYMERIHVTEALLKALSYVPGEGEIVMRVKENSFRAAGFIYVFDEKTFELMSERLQVLFSHLESFSLTIAGDYEVNFKFELSVTEVKFSDGTVVPFKELDTEPYLRV